MTTSPSDATLDGIRMQVRMQVTHAPEQRFDQSGTELLQLRGEVLGVHSAQPPLVVRFRGLRKAELYRWATVGKHLGVDGYLEVKTWSGQDGKTRVGLLVDAVSLFPLSELERDPSKSGIYSTIRSTSTSPTVAAQPPSKADRAKLMRKALERNDVT